jgi:hypothetical protein
MKNFFFYFAALFVLCCACKVTAQRTTQQTQNRQNVESVNILQTHSTEEAIQVNAPLPSSGNQAEPDLPANIFRVFNSSSFNVEIAYFNKAVDMNAIRNTAVIKTAHGEDFSFQKNPNEYAYFYIKNGGKWTVYSVTGSKRYQINSSLALERI